MILQNKVCQTYFIAKLEVPKAVVVSKSPSHIEHYGQMFMVK